MGILQNLRTAAWTARVVAQTFASSGLASETTLAGLRTAVKNLRQGGKLSPASSLAIHAANHPHRECLVDRRRRMTYRQVMEETCRLAHALQRRGIRPGDPIGVMLRNRAEFVIIGNAAARIGAPLVQLSYRFKLEEAAYILENAGARALFFDSDLAPLARSLLQRVRGLFLCVATDGAEGFVSYPELIADGDPEAPPPEDAQDARLLIYTSGTTGKPKGASRKVGAGAIGPTLAFLNALGLKSDDRHLAVCPLYHSAGIGFTVFTLMLGGTVVLLEHFDAEEVLRTIEKEKITTAMMVPTMYRRLVELPEEAFRRYDLSSLRRLVSGAAQLPVPLQQAVARRFGPVLCDFYGSTETGWNTLALPEDLARKPGTIGKAIPGNDIKLLDEEGREVPTGQVGQLYVRSMMQIDGYHANDEATRAAMRGDYFSVGDLAFRDEEGYYFLAGRKTDMVISGGVNIYPKEVEDTLHQHPAVADAAVIGVPHPEWGEALAAFLVLRDGASATADELRAFCKERMADFKCPREIFFVEELPRNPTGKILKKDIKQWDPQTPWPWKKGSDAAVAAPPRSFQA